MIVEWNVHMFSADTERYPWHPRAKYVPKNLEADPLAVYFERMRTEGIDAAVLVHPEPYGDDHRLVRDCLARDRERFRITSLFYPDDADAPAKLAALAAEEPLMVSTRFHAVRGSRSYFESFADAGVRAIWDKAAALGLIVELHIGPNYAAQAAELIAAYPETHVLIDHLAEPKGGTDEEYIDVLALAEHKNVMMKLSGLPHFATDGPLYASALPLTERVIAAFSPDRMVWGDGTPAIVDAHMRGYSDADRAKVKGDNLAKLLKFSG